MTKSRADLQKQPNYINRVITSRERKRDPNLIEVLLVHELMIEGHRVLTQLLQQPSKDRGIVRAPTGNYVSKGDAMSDSRQPDCYRCHGLSLGSPLCDGRWPAPFPTVPG